MNTKRLGFYSLKHLKVPTQVFNDIYIIKSTLKAENHFAIIGVGDYQFFYSSLDQLPPIKTPLWYHINTTVDESQELNLLKNYLQNDPDIILASDESDVVINYLHNNGYINIR
jgi:hypothetical protein